MPSDSDTRAFVCAAREGRLADVQRILRETEELNVNDLDGFESALEAAIRSGRVEVVRWLLQQGGNVFDFADHYGLSSTTSSADSETEGEMEPSTLTTNLLADLALYEGYKALVADWTSDQDSILRLLHERRACIGSCYEPFHDPDVFIYAISERHEAVIKLLIRRGADLNAEGRKHKWTPLMEALSSEQESIVRILLNAGALVDKPALADAKYITGEPTPLMYAARSGLALSVRLLLERRASVHKVDAEHQTALMHAAVFGNLQVMTLLLDAGSLIDAQSSSGQSALMMAAGCTFYRQTSHSEAVRLLHERGASLDLVDSRNWTALMHAAERGSVDTMMMLLGAGSPVNTESDAGETALMVFARRQTYDGSSFSYEHELIPKVIRLFIGSGASIDCTNNQGWTALMIAAYKGNAQIVHVLLEHGASLDIRSDIGETALSLARRRNHAKLISRLMMHDSVALSLHTAVDSTDNWASLFEAATIGDGAAVFHLIQAGVPIDKQTSTGETALMRAVWNRRAQVVRHLIEFDANLNIMDDDEWSALLISARIGDLEITQLLVGAGALIDAIGNDGESALMRAASNGHDDIVQLLIKEGANVHLKSSFSVMTRTKGWIALVYAVHKGFESVVKILIEAGADIDPCSDTYDFGDAPLMFTAYELEEDTPLMIAAKQGRAEIVRLLISHGAHVNYAKPTLDYSYTALEGAMSRRHQNVARILVENSAKVAQHSGYTPLMCAAKYGCDEIVCMLLQDGTFVDETDVFGKTALIYAAENGHHKCSRLLLQGGANVNHRSRDGKIALMTTVYSRSEACILELLQSGADIDAQDDRGYSALINACQYKKEAVVRLLVSWGAATELECSSLKNQTALIVAAKCGHENIVRQLIQANASINTTGSDGQCALSVAAECGHQHVVNALVESGACVNSANDKGRTPLMFAAEKGFGEVIRILLNAGADIDAVDHDLSTAIMLAVLQGQHEAVGLLRDRGASLDTRNKDGWSVLMLAADFGDNFVMRELLVVNSLLNESVGYLQAGIRQYDPTAEQVTPSIQSFGYVNPTEFLFDLCNGMLRASGICHHVCTRLHDVMNQLKSRTKIAQRGPMNHYQRMIDRTHIFLLKYSRNLRVIHLVGSNQIVETCRRFHRELDSFMLEYNLSAGSNIHCNWEYKFNENVKVYSMHTENSIQMDQNVIFEELQETEAQREVLILLLFEYDTRVSKYSEREIDLMHRIFQHISSISKLGISSVPSWFIPPKDVDVDEAFTSGSYGSIHHGRWKGVKVVVKCAFLLDSHSQEMFMNEVDIWYKLRHPNIIQLYKACHVGNQFFVCEYAENGTLSEFLYRTQDPAKMWEKLLEAARGLRYLHEDQKVVHGDLKCNNILVGGTCSSGDGPAKLTDFGLSFKTSSKNLDVVTEEVGAIQWKAPEVIEGNTRGSLASDVYSFGMCIVEAVKGGLPWGNFADTTVKFKLLKAKQFLSRPNTVNDVHWDLISRMCAWEPSDRPNMKYVVDSLEEIVRQQ